MLTCKQVSTALVDDDYMKLPWFKRILLRIHVGMCRVCGGYNKMLIWFYDSFREYRKREETILQNQPGLSLEQKSRIKEKLHHELET